MGSGRTAAGAAKERDFLDFAAGRTGPLYRSACLLTGGDVHLAEDLVQETLGRMFVHWSTRIDNPAGYAHTVLVRQYLAHQRRRSAGERPTGNLPDLPVPAADPELRLALLAALARLAARDRAILVLRYWEDRSIEETAEALRLSSSVIRTRSSRALARLREQLGDSLLDQVG
ncbi:SigE family RNA polymerase sigma factor [Kitasatospora sp. NPDC006697]|uniref:SigE family RNA polymerase sigma factor n=1 Tax=Kitasatospora sp. NPDC006697 TaxID=3364020 RepID=UPI00369C357A